jgi:hypothetical protein
VSSRPFDKFHGAMYPTLGVTPNKQMNVVRHNFHLDKLLLPLLDVLLNEHLESLIDPIHQNLAPILGTPDHMGVTSRDNICIVPNYCIHA